MPPRGTLPQSTPLTCRFSPPWAAPWPDNPGLRVYLPGRFFSRLESFDFCLAKIAPLLGTEISQPQCTYPDADNSHHWQS